MATKPVILTVDDDVPVLRAVERDLRARYGADYRIVAASSGGEAVEAVRQLTLRGATVALFIVDQRMPQMTGLDLLRKIRARRPEVRTVMLSGGPLGDQVHSGAGEWLARGRRQREARARIGRDSPRIGERVVAGERRFPAAGDRDDWRFEPLEQAQDDVNATRAMRLTGSRYGDGAASAVGDRWCCLFSALPWHSRRCASGCSPP